jgi:copper chaperone
MYRAWGSCDIEQERGLEPRHRNRRAVGYQPSASVYSDCISDFCMITRLYLSGMSCQHCINAVFTSLTPVPGITSADVSIGAAVIEHDGRATIEALREAIGAAGYEVILTNENTRQLPIV